MILDLFRGTPGVSLDPCLKREQSCYCRCSYSNHALHTMTPLILDHVSNIWRYSMWCGWFPWFHAPQIRRDSSNRNFGRQTKRQATMSCPRNRFSVANKPTTWNNCHKTTSNSFMSWHRLPMELDGSQQFFVGNQVAKAKKAVHCSDFLRLREWSQFFAQGYDKRI